MSDEKFEIHKPGKMLDYLESQVTDWAHDAVTEHFGVDSPEELARDEIEQVIEQYEVMSEQAGCDWLALGLRNVISIWENENDDYLI